MRRLDEAYEWYQKSLEVRMDLSMIVDTINNIILF